MKSLYEKIGEEKIVAVVTEFYKRAFVDMIIGHFFFTKDREDLTKKQIDFAVNMLGGPKRFQGRPLDVVHREFSIRPAHFDRRQMIMQEVLDDVKVEKVYAEQWLLMEEKLRKLIVLVKEACNDTRDNAINE